MSKKTKTIGAEIGAAMVATEQDFNAILSEKVNPATEKSANLTTGGHYNRPELNLYGLEQLIRAILRGKSNSTFPKGAETTELRAAVIGAGMFTNEIIDTVRTEFGGNRYTTASIRTYLTQKGKGIGKVRLIGKEDTNRPCPRPRCKWFLSTDNPTEKETATIA